jgi:surfactin synthase thioesterase subunit/acyl carrier protein
LPATSINLGVLGEYAGLSKMEETKDQSNNNNVDLIYTLERTGLLVMPLFEVLNNIDKAVVENRVNQLIAKINWKAVADTYAQFKLDARFTHIIKESKAITNRNTKEDKYNDIMKILSVDTNDNENIEDHANVKLSILHILKQIFSIVLAIPIDELNDLQSIATYGLDSIVLTQIHTKILQKLNVNYPLMRLFKGPTLVELSEDIFEEIVTNKDNIREENKQIIDVKQSSYKYGYLIINKWLVTFKRNENAKFRMFCFPSMGANATLFAQYLQSPPDNVEIFAIQMPGREHRVEDEKIYNFSELIEEMAKYILPYIIDKPFIFWGHSFGGLIAFQLLTYLNKNNGNNLKALHFIVSGTIPPNLVKVWKTRDMVNTKVDKEAVDAAVAIFPFKSDSTFLKEILPLIDSDMPLLYTYYDYGMRKLNCSITVFAGTEDQVIYSNEIDQWQLYTEKNFRRFDVKGDHWFLTKNYLFIQDKYKQLAATDFQ